MIEPKQNLCLTFPEKISRDLNLIAQNNLSEIADGYCLGETALPHITICQFNTDDASIVKSLQAYVDTDLSVISSIIIDVINIRTGSKIHEGYKWIEFTVRRTEELIKLQTKAYEAIKSAGAALVTATGDKYHPHITLGRIKNDTNLPDLRFADRFSGLEISPVKAAIVKSDRNGQLLGI